MEKNKNNPSSQTKTTKLTFFAFFAMTASMVMTVYGYPTFATSKANLIFYLLIGGFLWFLPVALCAAEMSTVKAWNNGSIFTWVGKTLGDKYGFAAIFFQWFQITVGFVTMIYFILGAISFIFNFPALNENPLIKFIAVLVVFWALTFSQFKGTAATAKISKIGFIVGVVIPAIALFVFLIMYLVQGHPINIDLSPQAWIPDFSKPSTLVVFVSFILAYAGAEASASHVNELENANKNYPLAMIVLAILAIVLNTIGGLSVAISVPQADLSLSSGVLQTLQHLISTVAPSMVWSVNIIGLLIALGVTGEISSWIVGPSRGIYFAAQQGIMPERFKQTNENGVPTNLLLLQGAVVTIWAAILTFGGGSSNMSFITAVSLTVVIYLVGYILFFVGYLKLISKMDDLERTYNVPGGKVGKYLIAGAGLIVSIFALIISFLPPTSIASGSTTGYELILIICFIASVAIPFLIYAYSKKKGTIISTNDSKENLLHHTQVNKYTTPHARGVHKINEE